MAVVKGRADVRSPYKRLDVVGDGYPRGSLRSLAGRLKSGSRNTLSMNVCLFAIFSYVFRLRSPRVQRSTCRYKSTACSARLRDWTAVE